jgi:hypothetical protein
VKCGNCKKVHASVAQVRECFVTDGAPSEKQMSLAQALGREKVRLPEHAGMSEEEYHLHIAGLKRSTISDFIGRMLKQDNAAPTLRSREELFAAVDPGRYALQNEEDDDVRFYFVAGVEPRYRRLYELIGAPGDFRRQRIYRPNKILGRIAEDPTGAFALYGLKVGQCGKCGSPLTQKHTRERGIGDICYGRLMESASS